LYLSYDQVLYVSLKKTKTKSANIKKMITLKKCSNPTYNELLDSAIHKLRPPFMYVLIHMWVLIKSFIDLRSRLSILAYKRKLLLVKHFHIMQQFKKIYHIKQNLIICFACEMNRIDPLVCVVMEPWISLIRFFEPDYDCLKKWSDITC
jgi:hypothetical protein